MITTSDILSENGPLADLIPNYRVRKQQIEMAEVIADAIKNGESIICEAGTGTGKTFAYLIPAILSGKKIIISTGTKHLQDQLFQRDLKTIQQAVGKAIHVSLLKGRENYLCLHRMENMKLDQPEKNHSYMNHLHDVNLWSQKTTKGDLAELTEIPEDAGIRKLIVSTRENCLGQECEFYDNCFIFKARRHANEADLTVVNHHLLLADMALREQGYGELLPIVDVVIFDEAHQLPELASQFFSQNLTSNQFFDLTRDSKQAYFSEASDMPDFLNLLENLDTTVKQLRLSFDGIESRIAWYEIRDVEKINLVLNQLMEKSMTVHQLLDAFGKRGKELDNCFRRLGMLINSLDMFIEGHSEVFVQWLELKGNSFFLHQTPLDIAEVFQSRMTDYNCQCVYTSATLTVRERFDHYITQMGLQMVRYQSWPSPFDYNKQAILYLPLNLMDPRTPGYTQQVVEMAIPVLKITRGRAFFLFTSHRALNIATELVEGQIDFPVLVQGRAPRTELLELFRASSDSILLGTQSFWEGVDVKGQGLCCVIIDKLPFATPDDPVLKARMKRLEKQGKNPFMEYQLPNAVIALKQGVGRLIRDNNDYGVLMICDPRLMKKSYGQTFLNSLPAMECKTKLSEVESFFLEHSRN